MIGLGMLEQDSKPMYLISGVKDHLINAVQVEGQGRPFWQLHSVFPSNGSEFSDWPLPHGQWKLDDRWTVELLKLYLMSFLANGAIVVSNDARIFSSLSPSWQSWLIFPDMEVMPYYILELRAWCRPFSQQIYKDLILEVHKSPHLLFLRLRLYLLHLPSLVQSHRHPVSFESLIDPISSHLPSASFYTSLLSYNTRWFLFHADTRSRRSSVRSLPLSLKTLQMATPISELRLRLNTART
jgi:hypothetical protein